MVAGKPRTRFLFLEGMLLVQGGQCASTPRAPPAQHLSMAPSSRSSFSSLLPSHEQIDYLKLLHPEKEKKEILCTFPFFFQIKENMILEFCTKIIVIFFLLQAPLKFIFMVPILKPLQRNCLWGLFDFLLKK